MYIISAQINNFRCFTSYTIQFKNKLTLIVGPNGVGKTSLLEALHYSCYMRSFKTHKIADLINIHTPTPETLQGFSIKLSLSEDIHYNNSHALIDKLTVQLKHNSSKKLNASKRTLKFNDKNITSYKELYKIYRVITITEDDLNLIQGSPTIRRTFIDQLISLVDPNYVQTLRKYKHILHNKNALLHSSYNKELYTLWSNQLFTITQQIQKERIKYLKLLEESVQLLNKKLNSILPKESSINIDYTPAKSELYTYNATDFEQVSQKSPEYIYTLIQKEYKQKRSLFGAHLDDYFIAFKNRSSKIYASRGQQKLIVFLLKAAQLKLIEQYNNYCTTSAYKSILLIDDFITDLDEARIESFISLFNQLTEQIIITSPLSSSPLVNAITDYQGTIIHI